MLESNNQAGSQVTVKDAIAAKNKERLYEAFSNLSMGVYRDPPISVKAAKKALESFDLAYIEAERDSLIAEHDALLEQLNHHQGIRNDYNTQLQQEIDRTQPEIEKKKSELTKQIDEVADRLHDKLCQTLDDESISDKQRLDNEAAANRISEWKLNSTNHIKDSLRRINQVNLFTEQLEPLFNDLDYWKKEPDRVKNEFRPEFDISDSVIFILNHGGMVESLKNSINQFTDYIAEIKAAGLAQVRAKMSHRLRQKQDEQETLKLLQEEGLGDELSFQKIHWSDLASPYKQAIHSSMILLPEGRTEFRPGTKDCLKGQGKGILKNLEIHYDRSYVSAWIKAKVVEPLKDIPLELILEMVTEAYNLE
jgi:hypothetical protein